MISLNKAVCVLLLSFVSLEAHTHKGEDHARSRAETAKFKTSEETLRKINEIFISEIVPIFKSKCLDCHGTGNEKPWYYIVPGIKQMMDHDISEAKEHMDMSDGFPFRGHGTPIEDLESLRDTLNEESMPPWQYKVINWDSNLTEKEKKIVYQWINKSINSLTNGGRK